MLIDVENKILTVESLENAAECRSDLLGNVNKWEADRWYIGTKSKMVTKPLFQLCGGGDEEGEGK